MFQLLKKSGNARRGVYTTVTHGSFQTPAFMPVGTQASVKGITPAQLKGLGAQIVLSNTYHLHLRPGDETIRDLGGLHTFMGWDGPILTDSGGFQIFSLTKLRKITDEGVTFQSHIDGKKVHLTPEKVVRIQENLGVDIMMVLDECLPYPAERAAVEKSLQLTTSWARRAKAARNRPETHAFGIVQGGMFPDLRKRAVESLCEIGFDGYSIGGLSVGEPPELMYEMTESTAPLLPENQIRYLMGVGTPTDLVQGVARGIDLFDCVIPTRSARFGRLYTSEGTLNIRNAIHRKDPGPADPNCDCYTCQHFSRAYLSHLIHAEEPLFVTLTSLHNLHYYQRLMRRIRDAIDSDTFQSFQKDFLGGREGARENK